MFCRTAAIAEKFHSHSDITRPIGNYRAYTRLQMWNNQLTDVPTGYCYRTNDYSSSSSSRSHLVVGVAAAYTLLLQAPACSVMDFIFRRSDSSSISDSVFLTFFSRVVPTPEYFLIYVVLVSPLYVAKPPQSRFPAPLCDSLYLQSLLDVCVSQRVS